MRKFSHIPVWIIAIIFVMAIVQSCSTQKNTPQTRWWHSFTAKYNTYYNGTLAYIDGSLEKEKANKDNYTELLPLYTVGNKASREIGKSNFDRAIEKSQKTIKLHSINKRPEWNKSRKKTERDIEWLSRKEYNPFLWRAWMLMGRSQFYKGAFDDAANTFTYMCRLYRTQPAIYGKARAWLAKCYLEQGWNYDAEDIIRNMQRDSIDWRAQKEWDYTYADYYLHIGDMENAARYLRKVIKHEMRSKQRAREYFLLGQIEASLGHRKEAYKAFRKVISQNPPYEMAFNARIAMTEVLANAGQAKAMISKLKRMAHNENNKDYLDQVYYAIGNIYLTQKDTTNAIAAYEKGNEKATRSGIEKGVLLLHLGDIYWQKEKYGDAGRCYGEAIGLLDRDRADYKQLSERSKVLDELVPYTDAIHMQDSLQSLARMDEKSRNEAIDRVITELKKREKEEKRREQEAEAERVQAKNNTGRRQNSPAASTAGGQKSGSWYFYSPTAVQQGKQAFEKQWGRRPNADDWRRTNKTVVGGSPTDDFAAADSLAKDTTDVNQIAEDTKKEKEDTAALDPHRREYYLAQIPFTPEQIEESNEIIKDGLFHSGIIFKDKLDNLVLSEKSFARLMKEFPDFEPMDEVYYHLFLLYSRKEQTEDAEAFIGHLKKRYPDSKWTTVLTDPYFVENARFGVHLEDSLYAATYNAFLADRHEEVKKNTALSGKRFTLGAHRDLFLFISGLSLLNAGDANGCLKSMEEVVQKYPQSKVSEMAGMIINGVKEGRKLHGANFSLADVWNRRTAVMADSDSIASRTFKEDRDIPFTFMLVYEPDSVQENRLLYQLARFNFTNFVVRNFDIQLSDAEGLHRMSVAGFRSFDEARQYARVLYQNDAMKEVAKKCRPIVISDENIPLLGTQYSYNDYDTFYVEHFKSLDIEREYMLYEPDAFSEKSVTRDVTPILPSKTADPDGVAPVEKKTNNEDDADEEEDEGIIMNEEEDIVTGGNDIDVVDDNDAKQKEDDVFELNETQENAVSEDDEEITLKEDETTSQGAEETVIDANSTETKAEEELISIGENAEKQTEEEFITIDDDAEKQAEEELIIVDGDDKESESADEEIILVDEKKSESADDDDEVIVLDDADMSKSVQTSTTKKDDKESDKSQKGKDDKSQKGKEESQQSKDKKDAKDSKVNAKDSKDKEKEKEEPEKEDAQDLEDEYYELEGF